MVHEILHVISSHTLDKTINSKVGTYYLDHPVYRLGISLFLSIKIIVKPKKNQISLLKESTWSHDEATSLSHGSLTHDSSPFIK